METIKPVQCQPGHNWQSQTVLEIGKPVPTRISLAIATAIGNRQASANKNTTGNGRILKPVPTSEALIKRAPLTMGVFIGNDYPMVTVFDYQLHSNGNSKPVGNCPAAAAAAAAVLCFLNVQREQQ